MLAGFLYQVGIGLALGFVVYLVFQAVTVTPRGRHVFTNASVAVVR